MTSQVNDAAPDSRGRAEEGQPHRGVATAAGHRTRPWADPRNVLTWLAALVVVAVHFRPWQGGLLEDWGLALAWENEGLGGLFARAPATLGRPLHLVPHYVGMAVSDGGFVGPYAVLALVAVLQLLGARWALACWAVPWGTSLVVALAIALHPWWIAGDVLRFLPAQVSVLGCVIWLGAAGRYLRTGRVLWVAVLVVAPMVGLLAYQAPSGSLAVGAVVLALVARGHPARRSVVVVAATVASVGAVLIWSVIIVPRLSPSSYESLLLGGGIDLLASLRAIARTLLLHAPSVVALGVLTASGVVGLGLARLIAPARVAYLLVAAASAPLTALIYASQPLHLNDPERVSLPVGVTLWLVIACAALCVPAGWRGARLVGVLAVVVIVLGAGAGYLAWTKLASHQEALIDAVEPLRAGLDDSAEIVVVDYSGRFGDVYTFLPPHLNIALDVSQGEGPDATLCTPVAVARVHPTAALYPLPTTPTCEELLVDAQVESSTTVTTEVGTLGLLVVDGVG